MNMNIIDIFLDFTILFENWTYMVVIMGFLSSKG